MPSPWPPIPAGSVSRIEIGGTPARNNPAFWARGGDGHLWVSIADMHEDMIYVTKERITDLGVRSSNVKPVPAGTPLMSFKLTVGRVAIAGADLFTNEAIAAFHVIDDEVSPRWLYHALPGAALKVVTDTAVKGATLNKAKLHELTLELPPPPEQRRIAEILDTLDEVIRRTEQVIAKLQQMKQGLLHDLLTRGIDENGELRDPERHPEQFQDSLLGRIPRGWTVDPLVEVADISSGTTPSRSAPRYWQGGSIPWIKTAEIRNNFIADSEEFVTPAALGGTGLRLYSPGTVLVAMYGQGATRGRSAVLGIPATTNQACAAIECEPRRLLPTYLLELLVWSYERLRAAGQGSNQTNLSAGLLGRLTFAWPPVSEQRRIDAVLAGLRARFTAEHEEFDALGKLKQGLMNDLLTGRVRVPVPEEAAP